MKDEPYVKSLADAVSALLVVNATFANLLVQLGAEPERMRAFFASAAAADDRPTYAVILDSMAATMASIRDIQAAPPPAAAVEPSIH